MLETMTDGCSAQSWAQTDASPSHAAAVSLSAVAPVCLIALALAGGQGCVYSSVRLRPPSPQDLRQPPTLGKGREIALISPFFDERPSTYRCGMRKNGYNTDTADVMCLLPPAKWLANALSQGLTSAGFRVSTGRNSQSPSAVIVQGVVLQFFVEPYLSFFTISPEADISVKLVVSTPSGLRAERVFYVKGVEVSFTAAEYNFQAAAESATQQAVDAMVRAIASLLDRYSPAQASPAVSLLDE
jgi:hypothetical protein